MHRMLKPGGRVGTALWAIHGYVADVRDALSALPAHVPALPLNHTLEGLYHNREDRWYDSAWVEKVVASAGFINVNARIIPFTSQLAADDYPGLISMLTNKFMKDYWSQSDRDKYGDMVLDAISTYFDAKYGKTEIATCKYHIIKSVILNKSIYLLGSSGDWLVTMVTAEKPTRSHRALTGIMDNWGTKVV